MAPQKEGAEVEWIIHGIAAFFWLSALAWAFVAGLGAHPDGSGTDTEVALFAIAAAVSAVGAFVLQVLA